ncbi:YbjN domain-containing protein [Limimaricola sp.]|uniref:YbjN domain-containing protein n=1 Tax=Limimaricola sp. TaxID=2211665 RepID=UPI0025B8A491|nr:YbjN domain-containing protein [Limimaricola sp.]
MIKTILRPVLVSAATVIVATQASAEIRGADPNGVLRAMQNVGYVAKMETDSQGAPMISSAVSSSKFRVFFHGCDSSGMGCTALEFSSSYDNTNKYGADKMNEWNTNHVRSAAYLQSDGGIAVYMYVNIDKDGVSDSNFADTLDGWRQDVEGFESFIGW